MGIPKAMLAELLLLGLAVLGLGLEEQQPGSGSRYIEYRPGNTTLVFTVPHDGQTRPVSIPNRQNGCKGNTGKCEFPGWSDCPKRKVCKALLFSDSNTLELAERAAAEFTARTGLLPHVVINQLHRSKLDPNREIGDAAQGDPEAEAAYTEFHTTIERVKESFSGGPGLLLDFHGQIHGQNSTELGYNYRKSELNSGDLASLGRVSSVSSLLDRTGLAPEALLAGEGSLGAAWERAGYRAVPSPRQPRPGSEKYYRGGYITQTHGSRAGGGTDAIQLELPGELRRPADNRRDFGQAIGAVLAGFHAMYYVSPTTVRP